MLKSQPDASKGRKNARTTNESQGGRGAAQNKGLRHFAMQVCNKIEAKGRTTYNEVADELVIELKDQPDGGDDKNIRRRVYDAFNVLLAVGIIGREGKKEIVWKGFPGNNSIGLDQAHAERARRIAAVEKKQKELQVRDAMRPYAHSSHCHPCHRSPQLKCAPFLLLAEWLCLTSGCFLLLVFACASGAG